MVHRMQFWENCLSPSCSSKERARHWQRWWDCSGRKISTLRHWKQEVTGQQWRSCWRSWNFICRATKIPWRFANRVQLKLTLQTWRLPRNLWPCICSSKWRGHVPWLINIWRWTWLLQPRKRMDSSIRKLLRLLGVWIWFFDSDRCKHASAQWLHLVH